MAKRPKTKTEILSVRISPKMKYGLELVARKHHLNLSDAVGRAIESYLEADGIAAKQPGEMLSLLDNIWNENEFLRTLSLAGYAPNLATNEEIEVIEVFKKLSKMMEDFEADNHDYPDIGLGSANALGYLRTSKGMEMMRQVASGEISIEKAFDMMVGKDRIRG